MTKHEDRHHDTLFQNKSPTYNTETLVASSGHWPGMSQCAGKCVQILFKCVFPWFCKHIILNDYSFFPLCLECLQHFVVHCGLHLSLKAGRRSGWHQVWRGQGMLLPMWGSQHMFPASLPFLSCCVWSLCVVLIVIFLHVLTLCADGLLSVVFKWGVCRNWVSAGQSEWRLGPMERVVSLYQDLRGRSAKRSKGLWQSSVSESP